jgi:hypothetical protein
MAGAVDARRAELGGVVGAQDLAVDRGDRQLDQRFVLHDLSSLRVRARRPQRFGDDADLLPRVLVGERAERKRDPGGIAAELVDVGKGQLPVGRAQVRPQPPAKVIGQRREHRLGAGQPFPDEGQHVLQVLARVAVEERKMAQATAAGVSRPRHRRPDSRRQCREWPFTITDGGQLPPRGAPMQGEAKDIVSAYDWPRSVALECCPSGECAWRGSGCRRTATAR